MRVLCLVLCFCLLSSVTWSPFEYVFLTVLGSDTCGMKNQVTKDGNNKNDFVLKIILHLKCSNPSNFNFAFLNVNSVRKIFDNFKERMNGNVDICTYKNAKNSSLRNYAVVHQCSDCWITSAFGICEGNSKMVKAFCIITTLIGGVGSLYTSAWKENWCEALILGGFIS